MRMEKKNLIKIFCMIFSFIILLSPISAIPSQAAVIPAQAAASGGETIEPRAPVIEWVYKVENGVVYRRMYNHSTGEWIGDWIRCD